MRLIGTLPNESVARRFVHHLNGHKILSSVEVQFNSQTGLMAYEVWVHDEDRLQEAFEQFKKFAENPGAPEYDLPPDPPTPQMPHATPPPRPARSFLTLLVTSLCIFLFLLNATEEVPLIQEGVSQDTFFFTPLQGALLYDFPQPFADFLEKPSKEGFEALSSTPYFQGYYPRYVLQLRGEDSHLTEGPKFSDIRKGEIYRLFTPILLHGSLLHILFNLIWFWILAKPIEERIGVVRLALLVLVVAAISNTTQYLMSGPFFLGISGVVAGLAGFVWSRERVAPWEGYPIQRSTLLFLALFLVAMFGLSLFSFFTQSFTNLPLAPNIANTAHLVGAGLGLLLGRISFFARRRP